MKPVYILVGKKKTGLKLHIHYPNSNYAFCTIGGDMQFATEEQIKNMPVCKSCIKSYERHGYGEVTQ
jgi:hypothetical protein